MDEDEYCEVVDEFGCEAFENLFEGDGDSDFRWIRVEKKNDPSIKGIRTQQNVFQKIEQVKREQRKEGVSDLYPRIWEPKDALPDDAAVNGDRVNGLSRGEGSIITVMQFNALAEGLSCGPQVKKPFRVDPSDKHAQNEKQSQGYGGFTSIPCPEATLDFSRRRWRLLEVILSSSDSLFDVIAMEEVDRYRGFFAPLLKLFGYEGLFMPKTRSPGVRMGWYSDGCCLFWRDSSFKLLSERRRGYNMGNQVFITASLRHIATGRAFVVAVTHLKAQKNETNEIVRCRQAEELLEAVAEASTRLISQGEEKVSILILGDFNADPPTATEGESAISKVLSFKLPWSNEGRAMKVNSAYAIDPPSDNFYTTWKIRGSQATKRIIDYIFYSGALECQATLPVPPEDQLEQSRLPSIRYPSDHVNLAAKFKIK